jgi:cytochrome b subunit of formate dehydrogenase
MRRTHVTLVAFIFAMACLLQGTLHAAVDKMAYDPENCLGCHGDKINLEQFVTSPHGKNGCTSCHLQSADLKNHMAGTTKMEKANCSRCHAKIVDEFASSAHAKNGMTCISCHSNIHGLAPKRTDKLQATMECLKCHDKQSIHLNSVHGVALKKGNPDAPGCSDCHGLHGIKKIQPATTVEGRMFHVDACIKCHSDEEMMHRNHVNTEAVATYLESYHGKGYRLGMLHKAAGCSDCHTAHQVLSKADPASSIHPNNAAQTCAQCHPKATALFAKFYSHGSHHDSENYPLMYWTFNAMVGLLVGTFAVFWLHTLLWMIRGFAENREKQKALVEGRVHHHISEPHKLYYRFTKRHIFLHLTVIVSFMGLSLTGLPLKFSDQVWAQVMMNFFGGIENAGLIHRGCAVLTFFYFASALYMSIDFLFLRKDIPGNFLQRMFGPDSLMPNLRDIQDVTGMVKWFLFKGPKPTFERWTYWEKFDFIAVFWGMFAIGGSGLLLWFPQFFGQFLPGWAFNLATIVHSDEALLATGFIFTVHFFNTHGRPEKFPMDFVIFNGQMAKEEFIEERGDQWKRYEENGLLPHMEVKKPSGALYDFVFKAFGFLAVITGVSLVVARLWAFLA